MFSEGFVCPRTPHPDPPPRDKQTPRYWHLAAVGMHPTGMHSCFMYNFHVNFSRWPNIEKVVDADTTNIWTDLYFCFQSDVPGTNQQILIFTTHNYFIICLEEIKVVLFRMNWYQINT